MSPGSFRGPFLLPPCIDSGCAAERGAGPLPNVLLGHGIEPWIITSLPFQIPCWFLTGSRGSHALARKASLPASGPDLLGTGRLEGWKQEEAVDWGEKGLTCH